MKKILIIVLTLSMFASCNKKNDETTTLTGEEKVALTNMENSVKEAEIYSDSIETCCDENTNIIDTAHYEYYDSILHACFTDFEHNHDQFGHGDSHCMNVSNGASSGMMNGGMMGGNNSSNTHCSGSDAEHGMGNMEGSESDHMDLYYNQMASFSHEMNLLKETHTSYHH